MTQARISDFESEQDLSQLSDAEREVYERVKCGKFGPREFQRKKGWSSPGTVSNLLRRAREKLGENT